MAHPLSRFHLSLAAWSEGDPYAPVLPSPSTTSHSHSPPRADPFQHHPSLPLPTSPTSPSLHPTHSTYTSHRLHSRPTHPTPSHSPDPGSTTSPSISGSPLHDGPLRTPHSDTSRAGSPQHHYLFTNYAHGPFSLYPESQASSTPEGYTYDTHPKLSRRGGISAPNPDPETMRTLRRQPSSAALGPKRAKPELITRTKPEMATEQPSSAAMVRNFSRPVPAPLDVPKLELKVPDLHDPHFPELLPSPSFSHLDYSTAGTSSSSMSTARSVAFRRDTGAVFPTPSSAAMQRQVTRRGIPRPDEVKRIVDADRAARTRDDTSLKVSLAPSDASFTPANWSPASEVTSLYPASTVSPTLPDFDHSPPGLGLRGISNDSLPESLRAEAVDLTEVGKYFLDIPEIKPKQTKAELIASNSFYLPPSQTPPFRSLRASPPSLAPGQPRPVPGPRTERERQARSTLLCSPHVIDPLPEPERKNVDRGVFLSASSSVKALFRRKEASDETDTSLKRRISRPLHLNEELLAEAVTLSLGSKSRKPIPQELVDTEGRGRPGGNGDQDGRTVKERKDGMHVAKEREASGIEVEVVDWLGRDSLSKEPENLQDLTPRPSAAPDISQWSPSPAKPKKRTLLSLRSTRGLKSLANGIGVETLSGGIENIATTTTTTTSSAMQSSKSLSRSASKFILKPAGALTRSKSVASMSGKGIEKGKGVGKGWMISEPVPIKQGGEGVLEMLEKEKAEGSESRGRVDAWRSGVKVGEEADEGAAVRDGGGHEGRENRWSQVETEGTEEVEARRQVERDRLVARMVGHMESERKRLEEIAIAARAGMGRAAGVSVGVGEGGGKRGHEEQEEERVQVSFGYAESLRDSGEEEYADEV